METTRITNVLKSLASAKAAGKLNVILSAPQSVVNATTKGPVSGTVLSSSKTGETIVKTEFGNLRLFSSVALKSGDALLLYSKGFGENLSLRVLPIGQNTYSTSVAIVTNDMPQGEQAYAVFRMPNQLKALATSVGDANVTTPYQPVKGVTPQPISQIYTDPASGSIIAFLSYVFSEKFDKNLKRTKLDFIPDATQADFAKKVARFISTFSSIDQVYKITEQSGIDAKLKADLINMAQTNFQLQGENWKMSIVPVFTGEKYIVTRFMSRKADEREDDDIIPSKRFFVDLATEQQGKILVDGLVSFPQGKAMATLVVKSEKRFPDQLEAAIMKATETASATTGVQTSVTFHKLQKTDPDPFSDILQDYYKGKLSSLRV